MFRHCKKALALFVAIAVVAPSAYLGLGVGSVVAPPQQAQAQLMDATASIASGLVTVAACYLAKFAAGLLSTITGWLGGGLITSAIALAAPTLSATEAALAKVDPTVVPVKDLYQIEQNALITAQLDLIRDSNASIASDETNLLFKECVLDPIAWSVKNLLIDALTQDIIDWIQGGFDGAPQFVEDPVGFLKDIADTSVRAFLFESGLNDILCEPFSAHVLLNIAWEYSIPQGDEFDGNLTCSFDEMFPGFDVSFDMNLDGVISPGEGGSVSSNEAYDQMVVDGNIIFPGGGFPAVLALLEDSNNFYGATFQTQSAAASFVGEQTGRESTLLSYGDGWFSARCDADNNPETARTVCTPGELISEQVNDWTGGQLAELEIADEFAEILNAIIQVLVLKLFEEVDGLLSNSGSLF